MRIGSQSPALTRLPLLLAAVAAQTQLAYAGGFEVPDNGTEALARGAAFTAKADDITALEYNVAGFARQRGTRLMIDQTVLFGTYELTRSGSYPIDPNNPDTGYQGKPYYTVRDIAPPFYSPFIGASSDFGVFDRWTFAIGVFGPPSKGQRSYSSMINGAPAPQRYDVTNADSLVAFATAAAAVRVTRWLDIGLALHIVYGSFDLSNVSYTPLGSACLGGPAAESPYCDGGTRIQTTALTATASIGLMFHPVPVLDIGASLRGPVDLDSTGTLTPTSPPTPPGGIAYPSFPPTPVEFHTRLPWVARLGVRYKVIGQDQFEHGDVELDGTYETWSTAEGVGDTVSLKADLGFIRAFDTTIIHHYSNTYSIRLGGAWNLRLPAGVLSVRAGAYFDSSATANTDTRMDFDTMFKVAGTLGLGYRIRGIAINAAYAYVWEPDRIVADGALTQINSFDGTATDHVVNNGKYHAANQIVAFNIGVSFGELLKRKRVIKYH
jgi:long-subunit fatty acid transport protein